MRDIAGPNNSLFLSTRVVKKPVGSDSNRWLVWVRHPQMRAYGRLQAAFECKGIQVLYERFGVSGRSLI